MREHMEGFLSRINEVNRLLKKGLLTAKDRL
jgi:hypothetical protein